MSNQLLLHRRMRRALPALAGVLLALFLPLGAQAAEGGPMRPIMEDMETNMARIAAGIWRESYGEVAQAASQIADHPMPPLLDRLALLAKLGSGAPRFMDADDAMKASALALKAAAEAGQLEQVLSHQQALQKQCVSCHSWYRTHLKKAESEPWEENL